MLERGQTLRAMPVSARWRIRRSSSMARMPWSMRSACRSSMASQTLSGPLDSPACTVRRMPASRAIVNASAKRAPSRAMACSSPSTERATTRCGRSRAIQPGKLGRLLRGLLAQDRDREVHLAQAVLGRLRRILRRSAAMSCGVLSEPGAPVRRVHDGVGVADARRALPCGERVRVAGRLLGGADEPALPVEEAEESAQPVVVRADVEQRARRTRQARAGRTGELEQVDQLEIALEVHVHLGLGERADPVLADLLGRSAHVPPFVLPSNDCSGAGGTC